MCYNYPTQAIYGMALLAAFIVPPGVAHAARMLPEPLLSQFEEGYGIAAAEVVDAKRVTPPDKYPALYDVVFKIHEVAAQPLQGEGFAFKPGDSIMIRLYDRARLGSGTSVGLSVAGG